MFPSTDIKMPKVKTNRVKYPEGWELIEPTLRELQAKMREGWKFTSCACLQILYYIILCCMKLEINSFISFMWQLRMIHMMVKGNVRHCGQYLRLHTRRAATYLTSTIGGKKFLKNCMNSVLIKDMLTAI